jgi:solute carrier family 35 (UDP-sugar transporter), member A1/2/3
LLLPAACGEVDIISMAMVTEFLKFVLAVVLYLRNQGGFNYEEERATFLSLRKTIPLYAVPAVIYSVYNYLQYVNLGLLDPAAYKILINMRIVISGFLMQVPCAPLQLCTYRYLWSNTRIFILGCNGA